MIEITLERIKNIAKDITSIPGWLRIVNQTAKKGLTKAGVPKFELWKFSDYNSSSTGRAFGRAFESVYSRFIAIRNQRTKVGQLTQLTIYIYQFN